jgi:hypothetical protein
MPAFGQESRATKADGTGTENCYTHHCSLVRELKVDPAEMRAIERRGPARNTAPPASPRQYL